MDPMIKHWVGLWDYLDGNFWNFWQWAAAHLSPNEVGWQPVPAVASIGWNLQHLGEMLDHYFAHVFGQAGPVQRSPLATMRPGSRDDGRHRDLLAIAAYHRQVRPAYRDFLSRLTAADLERPLAGSGRGSTWAWAVGHIAEHESYHLGKCMLLRNLLPGQPGP
jgi:hypothetical protein